MKQDIKEQQVFNYGGICEENITSARNPMMPHKASPEIFWTTENGSVAGIRCLYL